MLTRSRAWHTASATTVARRTADRAEVGAATAIVRSSARLARDLYSVNAVGAEQRALGHRAGSGVERDVHATPAGQPPQGGADTAADRLGGLVVTGRDGAEARGDDEGEVGEPQGRDAQHLVRPDRWPRAP